MGELDVNMRKEGQMTEVKQVNRLDNAIDEKSEVGKGFEARKRPNVEWMCSIGSENEMDQSKAWNRVEGHIEGRGWVIGRG